MVAAPLTYADGTIATISYEIAPAIPQYVTVEAPRFTKNNDEYIAAENGEYVQVGSNYYYLSNTGLYWKLAVDNNFVYIPVTDVRYIKDGEAYVEDAEGIYVKVGDYYLLASELDLESTYVMYYEWTAGNTAKNVLKIDDRVVSYMVRATVNVSTNYNSWMKIAYLRINPYETTIEFMSAGIPVDYVDFEYCGLDQTSTLGAYITALGADGGVNTDGTGNKIWMDLNVYAEGEFEETVLFRDAGRYTFVAAWKENEGDEYETYKNNYSVIESSYNVEMRKRDARIWWFSDQDLTTPYVDSAFTYDGTAHTVYASATTIEQATQNDVSGANVYLNGLLTPYDASIHGTHIQLYSRNGNVYELKELTADGSGNYFFYYLNGVYVPFDASAHGGDLRNDSRVYYKEGSSYFRVNTLCVYNPTFRRYVAYTGDYGPYTYGTRIQRFDAANTDTIALTVNTAGGADCDATTQTNAGRYLAKASEISGASENIVKNYNVALTDLSLNWVVNERVLTVTVDASASKIYDKTTALFSGSPSLVVNETMQNGTTTQFYTYAADGASNYGVTISNLITADVTDNNETVEFIESFTAVMGSANAGSTTASLNVRFKLDTNYIYRVAVAGSNPTAATYTGTKATQATFAAAQFPYTLDGEIYRLYNSHAHAYELDMYLRDQENGDYAKVPSEEYVLYDPENPAHEGLSRFLYDDEAEEGADPYAPNPEGNYVLLVTYEYEPYDISIHEGLERYEINRYKDVTIGASLNVSATIAPRPVAITWTYNNALVYNGNAQNGATPTIGNLISGDQVNYVFAEEQNGSPITHLTFGESATAPTNAGTYTTSVSAIDNANYTLTGATDVTSDEWSIAKRGLTVNLNGFVQSWKGNAWSAVTLTGYVLAGSDLTAEEKLALAKADGYANNDGTFNSAPFTVTLTDYAAAKTAASGELRNYVVNGTGSVIAISLNANYEISANKALTVSALGVTNHNAYEFNVASLADLALIESESNALQAFDPTYKQTANVSGMVGGEFSVYNGSVVGMVYGSYVGGGYELRNFTIIGSGDKVGFFGTVTGSVSGVNLRYVTVISNGANAKAGVVAAVANAIENTTAQGNLYVSGGTAGFIAAENGGAVESTVAVGYVKVLGGTNVIGGIVGNAKANVEGTSFVEVNDLGATAITAGGIAGAKTGSATLAGYSLQGSTAGSTITASGFNGTATAYAGENSFLTSEIASIVTAKTILTNYVMKAYYVGSVTGNYTIKNYRQLKIVEMYSWASYRLGANIYLPYSYGGMEEGAGEYAYSPIDENGKKIISSWAGTYMGVVEEVVE